MGRQDSTGNRMALAASPDHTSRASADASDPPPRDPAQGLEHRSVKRDRGDSFDDPDESEPKQGRYWGNTKSRDSTADSREHSICEEKHNEDPSRIEEDVGELHDYDTPPMDEVYEDERVIEPAPSGPNDLDDLLGDVNDDDF